VTASWFKGIFDWIIGATSTNYLSFNGTQLDFDEAALNATIDLRAVTSEIDPLWTSNFTAYNSSWSSTYNASYVPYTGANQNVDLGDNNFTVNGSTFNINVNTGRVGIGTDNPQSSLNINGTLGNLSGGLSFGDGDSGFYEASDDIVMFRLRGIDQWYLATSIFRSNLNGAYGFMQMAPDYDEPNILARNNDQNTGIGGGALDSMSLIAGGVEQLRLTQNDSADDVAYFSGNVGINTTTPQNTLNVVGDVNVTNTMYIGGATVFTDSSGNMIFRI